MARAKVVGKHDNKRAESAARRLHDVRERIALEERAAFIGERGNPGNPWGKLRADPWDYRYDPKSKRLVKRAAPPTGKPQSQVLEALQTQLLEHTVRENDDSGFANRADLIASHHVIDNDNFWDLYSAYRRAQGKKSADAGEREWAALLRAWGVSDSEIIDEMAAREAERERQNAAREAEWEANQPFCNRWRADLFTEGQNCNANALSKAGKARLRKEVKTGQVARCVQDNDVPAKAVRRRQDAYWLDRRDGRDCAVVSPLGAIVVQALAEFEEARQHSDPWWSRATLLVLRGILTRAGTQARQSYRTDSVHWATVAEHLEVELQAVVRAYRDIEAQLAGAAPFDDDTPF